MECILTATRPHVVAVAHSAELYGADRALHAALPELLEAATVTVAVPVDGPGIAVMEHLGARVVRLDDYALRRRHLSASGLVPWLRASRSAVRALGRVDAAAPVDVVWSNTLAATIGPLLARRFRAAHVLHVHECPDDPRWLAPLILATARADRVICNSHATAAWVARRRRTLAPRCVVVHNGLDLVAAPAAPPVPPADGTLRIACVARIHPKKGHAVLFEALRLARADGRRWRIGLYGDALPEHAPLCAELLAFLERHGLGDAVTWHGFVAAVEDQYGDADVAVVPSVLPEEFSLVGLEAQSMMLPVVATGPGGAAEVVADGTTGAIVPPRDARALYRELARLHDDPERRARYGRAGRARVESMFTREAYARGVRDVVMAAARRQPSDSPPKRSPRRPPDRRRT